MWLERMDYNLTEFINKIGSVMSQDDLNVTMNIKDPDNNIKQINLKSIGKFYGEIYDKVGEALFYFNRYLYVDPENGNDSNTGNSDAPLETLKRAFDLIPSGGTATITCVGGYDIYASDFRLYRVHNKQIILTTDIIDNGINVIIDQIDYDNNMSVIGVEGGLLKIACSVNISVDNTNFTDEWKDKTDIDYASFIGIKSGSVIFDRHIHDIDAKCTLTQDNKSTFIKVFAGDIYINGNYLDISNHVNDGGNDDFNILAVRGTGSLSSSDETSFIVDPDDEPMRVADFPGKFYIYTTGIKFNSGIPTNVIGAESLLPCGQNNELIQAKSNTTYIPSSASNIFLTCDTNTVISYLRIEDYDYHGTPWNINSAKQTRVMIYNRSSYDITFQHYASEGSINQFPIICSTKSDIILHPDEFGYITLTLDPLNKAFNWYMSKG